MTADAPAAGGRIAYEWTLCGTYVGFGAALAPGRYAFAVPTDPENLEARVTALENEMRIVRQDAAAARVLAVGADRDVADLKIKLDAHTKVLQALRETQLEHGERLSGVETRLDRVETRLDRVETRLSGMETRLSGMETEMRQGFATLGAGMAHVTTLLEGLVQHG